MKRDLLFTDAIVVADPSASGGDGVFRGWLSVDGGRIDDFGAGEAPLVEARRIPCGGAPLFAGLVNAHAHSHSSINRGGTIGLGLEPWLAAVRAEQQVLTDEDAYVSAMATYAELLAGGVTSVLDMCVRPDAAMRAASELGIRAVIAPFCGDRIAFLPPLDATRAILEQGARDDGRTTFAVSVHDLESSSDEQIVAAHALAEAFDVPFHMHCAETSEWAQKTCARAGVSPIVHLNHLGVLSSRTSLAHAIWLDDEDIGLLAHAKTGVVHCPESNLSIGSGVARVADLLDRGVTVALGTDGAKANQRLGLFSSMRLAAYLQRGQRLRADVVAPTQALHMAQRSGARLLRSGSGAIERGAPADLALLRADRIHLRPMNPEVATTLLVQAADPGDVRMTIVDGRVVYEDGALAFGSMRDIADSLEKTSDAVVDRSRR